MITAQQLLNAFVLVIPKAHGNKPVSELTQADRVETRDDLLEVFREIQAKMAEDPTLKVRTIDDPMNFLFGWEVAGVTYMIRLRKLKSALSIIPTDILTRLRTVEGRIEIAEMLESQTLI